MTRVRSRRVVIRLNGGLGNQMFQYAFAKAKASEFGARLVIDRSMFELPHVPERFRLDEFSLALSFTGPGSNLLHRTLLSPKLPSQARVALGALTGVSVRDEAQANARAGPATMLYFGYFQQPAMFSAFQSALREDFSRRLVGRQIQSVADKIEGAPAVAVHVRRGDYATTPLFRRTLGVLDAAYYRNAMKVMRERLPGARFFLFSNDHNWVGQELASDLDVTLVALGEDASDVAELKLMQSCRHFILANSTFSWWAAFLSDAPDKIVLAPDPWFREPSSGGTEMRLTSWLASPASWEGDTV